MLGKGEDAAMSAKRERSPTLLILIGASKILEAVLLIMLALGMFRLLHGDAQETLIHWTRAIRVDPDNRFVHTALERVTGLSPHKMEEIGLGTLLYGLLFGIEGVGLLFGKRWAEYVAVISTAGFLPIEVYEIFQKFRWTKVVVLILNILIVVYLVVRLWQTRPSARKDEPPAETAPATTSE